MQTLPDLRTILAGIRSVLVGGMALRAYMPERMTLDINILVHERDSTAVQQALLTTGYMVIAQLSIGGFTMSPPVASQIPIDVLTRADPWLDRMLDAPTYDQAGYPVLARPYLLLLKLQAGRSQDLADIQRLLGMTPHHQRPPIRDLVAQYSPEFLEDYDTLLTLADLEFGPPIDPANEASISDEEAESDLL